MCTMRFDIKALMKEHSLSGSKLSEQLHVALQPSMLHVTIFFCTFNKQNGSKGMMIQQCPKMSDHP